MGLIYKLHEFEAEKDLRYKADLFKNLLEQMGALGVEMTKLVNQELELSSGELIASSNEALLKHQVKNDAIIAEQLVAMDTIAYQYAHYINDLNKQYITLRYEDQEITS
ncbi:hypothetical protein ACFFIX_16930 [Metabacillus herbersteinensis]|uniref:PhoU domain-containing protein n=1 Tax=Metabacillus herbersteinensis TaxID=283816 RepID=A0ABV6GI15_9BACI